MTPVECVGAINRKERFNLKRVLLLIVGVLLALAAWVVLDNIHNRRNADRAVRALLIGLENRYEETDRLLLEAQVAITELPEWQRKEIENKLQSALDAQFQKERMVSNERFAVSGLRTINLACITYHSTYGGFPRSLQDLAPPAAGSLPHPRAAGLIDEVLASGKKSGYIYSYEPFPASRGRIRKFKTRATVINWGKDGGINLHSDESGVIRRIRLNRPATESDPPISEEVDLSH